MRHLPTIRAATRRALLAVVATEDAVASTRLAEYLASAGITAQTCRAGHECIELVMRGEPNILICDGDLPDMTGFELIETLRETAFAHGVPVLLLPGGDDARNRAAGYAAGADCILDGAYTEDEFVSAVMALMRRDAGVGDGADDVDVIVASFADMQVGSGLLTRQHLETSGTLAARFGRLLGLSERALRTLRHAGSLHDVGKLMIPRSILGKPGRLDPDERRVVQDHATLGARICGSLRSLRDVLPVVRHHHERWDGSGYPDGLAGEKIPLLARAFQLADIYEALTGQRPYRQAGTRREALDTLRDEADRGWWDPILTGLFVDSMERGMLDDEPGGFADAGALSA